MSRLTENKAKKYLFHDFKHEIFSFIDKTKDETGFDIWLINSELKTKQKIELKATEGKYLRNADIFQKLYFSAENEIVNFKNNETKILRVFLGDEPPKLFIFDNEIFKNGATFEPEARWIIKGKKNYDCIQQIDGMIIKTDNIL